MKKQLPKREGNKYDKILKENIKKILMPFVKKRLGVKIKKIQPLPEKLQTTLEREVDSSSLVETIDGEKFILHIEFEVNPRKDMIYRMGEYHGIEMRKSKMKIKHYVFYLGEKKTKIRTKLKPDEIFTGFELFNMREESPEYYLKSEMPEEVILALLANYPKDEADEILDGILQRLHSLCNPSAMKKYQKQLTILSRMRKLEEITKKKIIDMPIHYDIESDHFYLEGVKATEEKMAKKMAKKMDQERREKKEAVLAMLKDGISVRKISQYLKVTQKFVKECQKELGNN